VENEDRTEAATPARLNRAQSEGQAAVSHELASFANLGAALLIISAYAPQLCATAAIRLGRFLASAGRVDSAPALIAALHRAAQISADAALPLMLGVVKPGWRSGLAPSSRISRASIR
jgi:flagellar biosynthesis protein FlhB